MSAIPLGDKDGRVGGLLGDWYGEFDRREDEQRLAKEAQAAADAAALQHDLDRLDKMALEYLKDELVTARGKARTTKRQRQDYAAYRSYCTERGWPETAPQAVFAYLLKNISRGVARVKRLIVRLRLFKQASAIRARPVI